MADNISQINDNTKIDLINSGKLCPYCNHPTEYIDSTFVYGRSFGMIYICKSCDAYVGVHEGTDNALGRLANKDLRAAKIKAHASFDKIFKDGLINKIWKQWIPNISNRKKAYRWLSIQMNIPEEQCHIGVFDIADCYRVIHICHPYLQEEIKPYEGFESNRMIEAKQALQNLGLTIIYQDLKEMRFLFNGNVIKYFPDSAWHSGKGITAGRGLKNLLDQLITK